MGSQCTNAIAHRRSWKPQLPIFLKNTFLWVHGLMSGPAVLSDHPVVVRCISSDFASLFVECETYSMSWYLQNLHGLYVTWLVVWNIFIFPYIGNNHPNPIIFFRGVETTNQSQIAIECRVHLPSLYLAPPGEARTSQLHGGPQAEWGLVVTSGYPSHMNGSLYIYILTYI